MESERTITNISNVDILKMFNSKKKSYNKKLGGGKYYSKKNFDLHNNRKCSTKNCFFTIDSDLFN